MSSEDVWLSRFLGYQLVPWAALAILALLWVRYGLALREYVFAVLYTRFFLHEIVAKFEPFKRRLFADLGEFESRDWKLRNEGLVRILEVGCGPGTNFPFYPSNNRVVCCDPNPAFASYLFDSHVQFPQVVLEKFLVAGGEDLSAVEDESVDVVVSTLVNCSVKDVERVLSEVRRVLAPGGRYYFLDHVVQPKGTNRYWVGKVVKPFFQFALLCDLQRDILPIIKRAGFSTLDVTEFDPEQSFPIGWLVRDFIMGCATK